VPNSSGSLTAVVVSGGKQYRVASGDRILVDRVAAEPGSRLTLERVLLLVDGDDVKVGAEALAGQVVTARVLGHRRGPKIDVLRYRPKKRVRVHRGARAALTALEIVSVGPPPDEKADEEAVEKRAGKKEPRGRARAATRTDKAASDKAPADEAAPEEAVPVEAAGPEGKEKE
jgi:large subunit ribosomal protein L21